jgi:hypothetical protein
MLARSLLAIGAPALLLGCGNLSSSSELAADGTISQRIRLSVPKAEIPSPEPAPEPAQILRFDPAGGWTTQESSDDDSKWIEGLRTRRAGEPLPMFTVNDKRGPYLASTCEVEKSADGKLVFTETYVWTGEIKDPPLKGASQATEGLRKFFAKAELDDDRLRALEEEIGVMVWRTVFGPSDPLLGLVITNPAAAEKRISAVIGAKLIEIVEKHTGGKMSRDEIIAAVREGKGRVVDSGLIKRDRQMTEGPSDDQPNIKGLLVSIKGPGRLVESNGVFDPIENEVYWSFYDVAAQVGPVVLRAVFQP